MSTFLLRKTIYLKIYSIVNLKRKYLLKCQIQRLHPRRHSSLALGIAQLMKNSPAMMEILVQFLAWEDPWRRDRLPTSLFLGFPVTQMVKNPPAMRETWVQSLGWEDLLEEGMQPTPLFLPRESPQTEEPGGLQCMGLQRVGHN